MPRLISAVVAIVVGFLDGAGLGAISMDFFPSGASATEAKVALTAALITGPLGALLGLLFALHGHRTPKGSLPNL